MLWTVIAVGIVGMLIAVSITRQGSPTDSSPGISKKDINVEVRSADELPEAVLQKVAAATETETKAVNETVRVIIKTTEGDIEIELYGAEAPMTVGNFVKLARLDFYDGLTFHRVIPGFMVQAGDPLSATEDFRKNHGAGGPGYIFEDEINDRKLVRGSVAMANGGLDTNGSQFFIVVADATPNLDGIHTNFGQVINGMDVVVAISQVKRDEVNNPLERVEIFDVIVL